MCRAEGDVSLSLVGKGAARVGSHSVAGRPGPGHRGPSPPETDHIWTQDRKSHFFSLILIFFSDLEQNRHEQREL